MIRTKLEVYLPLKANRGGLNCRKKSYHQLSVVELSAQLLVLFYELGEVARCLGLQFLCIEFFRIIHNYE